MNRYFITLGIFFLASVVGISTQLYAVFCHTDFMRIEVTNMKLAVLCFVFYILMIIMMLIILFIGANEWVNEFREHVKIWQTNYLIKKHRKQIKL